MKFIPELSENELYVRDSISIIDVLKEIDLVRYEHLLDILVSSEIVASRGEGRRLIMQGAIYVNNNRISDIDTMLLVGHSYIIKKGKKQFVKVTLKGD